MLEQDLTRAADATCISVLIVDDHPIVRQGLRTLLELQDDIQVVGEAVNGKTAVEMAARLKPDVVLMDLVMPEVDGISATRQISALKQSTQVIALTSFVEDDKVIPAIQAGAVSFLLKDVSPNDLMDAIRAAHHGEARLHPQVMRKLMEQVAAQPAAASPAALDLTQRESEVLTLVAEGLSNREIAVKLVISEKTVKTHISSLLSKLDQGDRTRLAIFAIKKGLVAQR
ncbi:MAG: response regulator transcription factor [Anaerolineae bacterium]|nr:response regulator transcription factor [Anaerolineae bacterium]